MNKNPKHLHLDEALKWIKRIKPEHAYLTHLGSKMDYQTLVKTLPQNVSACYDGLVINLK